MGNYVVTGFNEKYWQLWGASWLISLKELAKHDVTQIAVVGFGLSSNTINKINDTGVVLFSGKSTGCIRNDVLRSIVDLARKESAIFAYWDADVFFQEDISEIFSLAQNDLVISSNKTQGFIAGPSHQWMLVHDILNMMNFLKDKGDFHDVLIRHFSNMIIELDNTWNFSDIPHLKDIEGKLTYKGLVQKVIHPSGQIKKTLSNKGVLFWERHNDLYRLIERKKTVTPKMVSKSVLDSNLINNK